MAKSMKKSMKKKSAMKKSGMKKAAMKKKKWTTMWVEYTRKRTSVQSAVTRWMRRNVSKTTPITPRHGIPAQS